MSGPPKPHRALGSGSSHHVLLRYAYFPEQFGKELLAVHLQIAFQRKMQRANPNIAHVRRQRVSERPRIDQDGLTALLRVEPILMLV